MNYHFVGLQVHLQLVHQSVKEKTRQVNDTSKGCPKKVQSNPLIIFNSKKKNEMDI